MRSIVVDPDTYEPVADIGQYKISAHHRMGYLFQTRDVSYLVDVEDMTCTCDHFLFRAGVAGGTCKHLRLATNILKHGHLL